MPEDLTERVSDQDPQKLLDRVCAQADSFGCEGSACISNDRVQAMTYPSSVFQQGESILALRGWEVATWCLFSIVGFFKKSQGRYIDIHITANFQEIALPKVPSLHKDFYRRVDELTQAAVKARDNGIENEVKDAGLRKTHGAATCRLNFQDVKQQQRGCV